MATLSLQTPQQGKDTQSTFNNLFDAMAKYRKELENIMQSLDEENVIRAQSVVADWVYANTIKASQIDVQYGKIQAAQIGELSASQITTGSLNANLITAGSINASLITSGSLNADIITSGNINANLITTGALNANLITAGTLSADRVVGGYLQGRLRTDSIKINGGNGYSPEIQFVPPSQGNFLSISAYNDDTFEFSSDESLYLAKIRCSDITCGKVNGLSFGVYGGYLEVYGTSGYIGKCLLV